MTIDDTLGVVSEFAHFNVLLHAEYSNTMNYLTRSRWIFNRLTSAPSEPYAIIYVPAGQTQFGCNPSGILFGAAYKLTSFYRPKQDLTLVPITSTGDAYSSVSSGTKTIPAYLPAPFYHQMQKSDRPIRMGMTGRLYNYPPSENHHIVTLLDDGLYVSDRWKPPKHTLTSFILDSFAHYKGVSKINLIDKSFTKFKRSSLPTYLRFSLGFSSIKAIGYGLAYLLGVFPSSMLEQILTASSATFILHSLSPLAGYVQKPTSLGMAASIGHSFGTGLANRYDFFSSAFMLSAIGAHLYLGWFFYTGSVTKTIKYFHLFEQDHIWQEDALHHIIAFELGFLAGYLQSRTGHGLS